MTRAEFVQKWSEYWISSGYMKEGQSFKEAGEALGAMPRVIVDVATNGFDPEPTTEPRVILTGSLANAYAQRMLEEGMESAKRSRPFVGSHKLPFDSDWD